jgi:hypothetical protein
VGYKLINGSVGVEVEGSTVGILDALVGETVGKDEGIPDG